MSGIEPLQIVVDAEHTVSALLQGAAGAAAGLVLAHGAGAGMRHAFMAAVADGLATRGVATLRYQFPYMERGAKRTDPPPLAHATVRAAAAEARRLLPGLAWFAGGKSFGGRMTSQAEAELSLAGIGGLVFFGFPLHLAGKPGDQRAQHLSQVQVPMLFLQGTRDELADPLLMRGVVESLGERARALWIDGADHGFHVLARSGRTDAEVREAMLDQVAEWIERLGALTPC